MKVTKKGRRIVKVVNVFVAIILAPVHALYYLLLPFIWITGFSKGFVDAMRGK